MRLDCVRYLFWLRTHFVLTASCVLVCALRDTALLMDVCAASGLRAPLSANEHEIVFALFGASYATGYFVRTLRLRGSRK